MEKEMKLKETCPVVLSSLNSKHIASLFGKSRQTIYNWLHSDVNNLSFHVVMSFSKLEEAIKKFNLDMQNEFKNENKVENNME
jgi:hypothetical protein